MKIFDDQSKGYGRSRNSCGYCRQAGHNKYQCPEVDKDWAWWKNFTVPPYSGAGWMMNRSHPKYWGDWYNNCKEIYEEKERRKSLVKQGKSKRAKPKCGFCGGEGHNRSKCIDMRDFNKKCYKANENWRRAAYKEIVEKKGICVGACIKVRQRDGWTANYTEHVGIITSVNFDKLNVMAAHDGTYSGHDNPYECTLAVKALVEGREVEVGIATTKSHRREWNKTVATVLDSNIVRSGWQGWHNEYIMDSLLSPSEHPLDESWVTDYKDAFDYLTKKRKKSQLDNDHVTSLINKWAKKV